MSSKEETRLQRKIQRRLKSVFGGWFVKIHGGPFQQAGLPDLLGCVCGLFFGLEVKVPKRGRISEIQKETIADICEKGGGFATVVTSSEEAIEFIRETLRQEGRLLEAVKAPSTKSRRIRRRS